MPAELTDVYFKIEERAVGFEKGEMKDEILGEISNRSVLKALLRSNYRIPASQG